ncbi:MFS transporter [archaeon]|nr:MFS transporter [archaeon]MBT4396669.1 MFS transporter [archaeon]MBT4441279.1 MFS transporter [archaeon]
MKKELQANIWKFFILIVSNRRNYIPILALYFLSLPNTTAQQIGIYTGIGWFAGFILEIPSGYISDIFGHKKTLIMAKFSMLISTLFFIFGNSFPYFILGAIFMGFGFSFTSGTSGAFLHNTLVGLKREKEYGEIFGKLHAKASLVSAVMILLLPLLAGISLVLPIKVFLIFDLIGIVMAFSLFSPKIKYSAEDEEGEKIWSQLKKFKGTGFYITSLFLGIISAFVFSLSVYKEPFVALLGFPIILIGSIMALSRVFWFVIGHNLKQIKKINIKKLLFFEMVFFSGSFILISQLLNPYILGLIFAIQVGYFHARNSLIDEYYINNFLLNRRFKATMLSIKQQIGKLFQSVLAYLAGFIMVISYSYGYLVFGIIMLISLVSIYPFMVKYLK